jgi:hypothetical protein
MLELYLEIFFLYRALVSLGSRLLPLPLVFHVLVIAGFLRETTMMSRLTAQSNPSIACTLDAAAMKPLRLMAWLLPAKFKLVKM